MDVTLSDEQTMIVDLAKKVGERFGLDYWLEQDRRKEFPGEAWLQICKAGLGGATLAEEYGGGGQGTVEMALIVEELAAAGAGATVGQLFMLNPVFGGVAVSKYGSDAMKEEVLTRLASGELTCCMALTEPDAGTNTLEMRTMAKAVDGGWRISGTKTWITAVPNADKMLIVARSLPLSDTSSKSHGISMFLVDRDRTGIQYETIEKVGTNTLSACTVYLD